MIAPDSLLTGLLYELFPETSVLMRFAAVNFGLELSVGVDSKASGQVAAKQLAKALEAEERIDQELFDLLLEQRPEHEESIERVRRTLFGDPEDYSPSEEAPPEGKGLDSEVVDEAHRSWRQRMANVLDSVNVTPKEPPAAWIEAMAVLPSFDPMKLHPFDEAPTPKDLLETFTEVCEDAPGGRLTLSFERRRRTLALLANEGRLSAALDANPHEQTAHTRLLSRAASGEKIAVDELEGLETLQAASDVGRWLGASNLEPFDRSRVASKLERYRRVEPLRKLTGTHFRGRVDELAQLHRHLGLEPSSSPPREEASTVDSSLFGVWGIGGVGKSTLVGKVVLDLEKRFRPWVYLDFDDPRVEPLDASRLVEHIAQQLAQFFAHSPAASRVFTGLESSLAGDEPLSFTLDLEPGASLADMLAVIDRGLRLAADSKPPCLCLVLDTFEQVQVRGGLAVGAVRSLLDAVVEALPYARVIVSGRAKVAAWRDVPTLELGNLDADSADAVLEALGVEPADLRQKICARFGTSPLSLRLVAGAITAEVLEASDIDGDGFDHEDADRLLLDVCHEELQGQLYTRILGHVRDAEVRRLAHPGLIVRRVTPAIIRDVLAEVCDIDAAKADAIFDRLPDHVTLFTADDVGTGETRALRHRQDVREMMVRRMLKDPAWEGKLRPIHDLAVAHYAPRRDAIGRAEELYHRLMRGDDRATLDRRFVGNRFLLAKISKSLARSFKEPMPEPARRWLSELLGHESSSAPAVLEHGVLEPEVETAKDAETIHDAQTLLDAGDAEAALELIEARLAVPTPLLDRRPNELLVLRLLAAGAALEIDHSRFTEHVTKALDMAQKTNNVAANLRAHQLLLEAARGLDPSGKSPEIKQAQARLEKLLQSLDDSELRRHPELAQAALQSLQSPSSTVLRKFATAYGNRARQTIFEPNVTQLGDLLSQLQTTDAGQVQLEKLAGKVGVSTKNLRVHDLANQSIVYGKLGDALTTVIDFAPNDVQAQRNIESMIRPVATQKYQL